MIRTVFAALAIALSASGPAMAQSPSLFDALHTYWQEHIDELPNDRSAMAHEIIRTCYRYIFATVYMNDAYITTRQPSAVLALVDDGLPEDHLVREVIAAVVLDRLTIEPEETLIVAGLEVGSYVNLQCYDAALRALWGPKAFAQ